MHHTIFSMLSDKKKLQRFFFSEINRPLANLGFVDFLDYFGRFSIPIAGVIYEWILPLQLESKSGSKEPENRQNLS